MVSRAFIRIDTARAAPASPRPTGQQRVTQAGGLRGSQPGNVLLGLQRTRGNHYVQQLVNRAGPPIQARLRLGLGGDQCEQEADRVARTAAHELVSRGRGAGANVRAIRHRPVAGSSDMDAGLRPAVERARGDGRPLPENVRGQMELALGADFSEVRVHSDARADRLNGSLDARAFTTGRDIFFRRGEYSPDSRGGQRLLAHELVHVVQQRAPDRPGSGDGPTSDGVIQRVRRGGSYKFIWMQRDLTNKFRPVYLMVTARDGFSHGEDVVVKFEPEDELMDELFFSKAAGRSDQMVPDMRRANQTEVKRCKKILTLFDINVKYNDALIMDFVPGSKLEGLRAPVPAPYQLSAQQLRNIGRLLAFQIFMGGRDMLPAPHADKYNFGNVIVSTAPGSSAVSMIDVTPGFYDKSTVGFMYPTLATAVTDLVEDKYGGALTEDVREKLAKWFGTFHNVGDPGRMEIREGFIESMRDITEFDLTQFDADWKAVFPAWTYHDAMDFMWQMQELFRKFG
jgi:hypothetical protein